MVARKRRKENSKAPEARAGDAARSGRATPPESAGEARLPGWAPWVLFAALTLVLFRAFVLTDAMLLGGDTLSLGYVARAFLDEQLSREDFPGWAPRILGGTPFLEALSGGDSLYPPSLFLLVLLEPYRALGWKLVLHVFLAGVLMFAWARTLRVSRAAALVAGTGYLLTPMLIGFVRPGHDGKLFVMALAPLMFLVVERFFLRPALGRLAAIGLVVALVISTTHFQMAWFLFLATGAFALFRTVQAVRGTGPECPRGERGRAGDPPPDAEPEGAGGLGAPRAVGRFGLFLAAAVLGAAGAGVQLLPAFDYVTEHSRRVQTTRAEAGETGVAWSSSWSIHPEEAMSVLIPEFAGNDAGGSAWASGTYWGRNALKDNHESPGLVVLLLALVAFAGGARAGLRSFLAGTGLVAFLFALGSHTPVWRIFYAVVPGISLFRAPSQAMFLFCFAAATLSALGTDRLLAALRAGKTESWRPVLRVLTIAGGGLALLALLAASGALTSLWTGVVYPDVDPARLQRLELLRPFIVRGAFLSAVLGGAILGVAWLGRRGIVGATGLVWGLVLLVVADGLRVVPTFVQTIDFQQWAEPDPNLQALLDVQQGDPEPYRLLSLVQAGQDVKPSMYGIELAAGHHPNDLSRYRELIGMVGSGFPENLLDTDVRRLLNVRYILWPDAEIGPAPQGPVVSRTQFSDGRPYRTLLADAGLPRARLVGGAVVKSDAEAVPYILSDAFDPEREVVLAEPPPTPLPGGAVEGSVSWTERTPDAMTLSVTASADALLVIADNWFPAWRASVDGEEAPVLRAYHTLRAVPVPAGTHEVRLWYASTPVRRGALLSATVLLALLTALGLGLVSEARATAERGS